jgi:hypothetical protein
VFASAFSVLKYIGFVHAYAKIKPDFMEIYFWKRKEYFFPFQIIVMYLCSIKSIKIGIFLKDRCKC